MKNHYQNSSWSRTFHLGYEPIPLKTLMAVSKSKLNACNSQIFLMRSQHVVFFLTKTNYSCQLSLRLFHEVV